jgi:hypothetical protein
MTKKIYKGCGPPPLYGEDVTAAALVYKARNKRQFPNLFGEREAVEIDPFEEDASNMTIEQRAMALATDNFARHGGIERLENGAFDTERVAFWVTYDPSLGGPTVAERIKKRALNNVKHWPSAFHYYAMKHAYINGASPKVEPWSLDRRTIIVAVRGTDNKQDRQLDKEAGHEMYWYRTSNAVGESSIYLNDVRPAVLNAQLRYPTENNDYFATGHSLGGALADELVRDGLVKGAVDFNPLISAFNSRLTADPELVHRIYTQDDIVFSILKSLLPKMALKRFNDTINIVPTVYKGVLASHSMDNFSAGLNENNLLTPPEGERYLAGNGKMINHRRSTGIFTSEFRDLVNDIKMNHERLRNAMTHLKALEGLSYRDNSQRFEELYEIHHDAEEELILNTKIAISELSSYLNATGQNDTMNNKTARAAKPVVDALKYLISIDAWPENRVTDDYASSIGQSESSTLPIGGDMSDTTVPTEFFTGSGGGSVSGMSGGAHTLYHKTKLFSIIRRKRDGRYAVITNDTQKLHGWTTLTKAKKQMRLLYAVEHGWKPTHQIKGGATEEERGLAARIRESYDFQNVGEPWKLLLHAAHSIVHDASNEPIYTGRNDDGTHVINILRQLNTNTLPQYYPLISGPKRRTNNVFDTKRPIERASAAFRAFENQPPREARRFVAQPPPPPSSVPPSDASKFRSWVKDN